MPGQQALVARDAERDLDRAALRIDHGRDALDRGLPRTRERLGQHASRLADEQARQLPLGHEHPGDDRVEVDDLEQPGVGLDVVAHVDDPLGDDAGNRRLDRRVAKFPLGVLERELELLHVVARLVVGLLADQVLLEETPLALVLQTGALELALDPPERRALRLVLEQQHGLAGAHRIALLDEEVRHVALGLGQHVDDVLGFEVGRESQHGLDPAAEEGQRRDGNRIVGGHRRIAGGGRFARHAAAHGATRQERQDAGKKKERRRRRQAGLRRVNRTHVHRLESASRHWGRCGARQAAVGVLRGNARHSWREYPLNGSRTEPGGPN